MTSAGSRPLARCEVPGRAHSLLNFGLIDEHDGNVVANGIDAVALHALKTAAIRLELDCGLTKRTDQDLEQLFANSHIAMVGQAVRPVQWASCRHLHVQTGFGNDREILAGAFFNHIETILVNGFGIDELASDSYGAGAGF